MNHRWFLSSHDRGCRKLDSDDVEGLDEAAAEHIDKMRTAALMEQTSNKAPGEMVNLPVRRRETDR